MKSYRIFGINFVDIGLEALMNRLKDGGLLVVPAAPALVTIPQDSEYHDACKSADYAIFDSGLLVILLGIFKTISVKKLSGLKFLRYFILRAKDFDPASIFLVDPSKEDSRYNREYFISQGINIHQKSQYCSPMYQKGAVKDDALLQLLEELKPTYVIVNIGGGKQEPLGAYLKKNLTYKPAIICTGAAVAFLTGRQASIPKLIDNIYLGWLFRILSNPKIFLFRYLSGFKLVPMLLKEEIK